MHDPERVQALRKPVSLPYYELLVDTGRERRKLYLEAFLSRFAGDRLLCLLASLKPAGLEEEARGLKLAPWAPPEDVLSRYLEAWRRVVEARPEARGQPSASWALKRVFQEINRLFFGGMVVGPPAAPSIDREALSARLAARLCSDLLGWVARSKSYLVAGSRLLWRNVEVEFSGGEVKVSRGGREERILSYVLRESREAASAVESALADAP
jgi:hypothetical protein